MTNTTGFELEIQDDIYIYHVRDIRRDTVDAIVRADQQQIAQVAQTSKHALRVWSIEAELYPTPYLTSKAEEIVHKFPADLRISTAVVVPNVAMHRIMAMFLQRLMNQRLLADFRVVNTLPEALAWLKERREDVANS